MKRTAIVFSPIYYQHNTGKGHPEKAKRLKAIVKEVSEWNKLGQKRNIQFVKPEKARIEDVEIVHMPEYVKLVEAVCKAGGGLLDLQDTVVSSNSFDVALYAVGGTLTATHLIMEGKNRNAFALVRPPGHHAARHRALGFCLFNNAAIAAQHLIEKFNLKRILILDLDAHHGNGTQEIFYATDKVLYVSLHEDPAGFPGAGFAEETGKVDGKGFNVNVPLPFGTGDSEYLQAINEIAMPIARQYEPQFVVLSAGFDAHYADPVGQLSLSVLGIKKAFKATVDLASELCQERLLAVLEGGYNLETIGKLATSAVAVMSNDSYVLADETPTCLKKMGKRAQRAIKKTKKVQSAFWNIK